mmetsp:Transcript_35022/g.74729  ORF Transcript_35022/g.74729 Transcript_35022/m.74729 type:complete len:131 (+) Transcript_35022:1043-1435(+)
MGAPADKKERKALIKAFEVRRAALDAQVTEHAAKHLPELARALLSLHAELRNALALVESGCVRERAALRALPEAERRCRCRIFYDGTSDDIYSNFKACRFAIGPLGFIRASSSSTWRRRSSAGTWQWRSG